MIELLESPKFSGSAKVWSDFATASETMDIVESDDVDDISQGELRDEYIRLPFDDMPQTQECRW